MVKRKKTSSPDLSLDLNRDGVVDAKDKSIAGKVLASRVVESGDSEPEEVVEFSPDPDGGISDVAPRVIPVGGRIAAKDINLIYRRGDCVPDVVVEKWEFMGLDISGWFED